MGWFDKYCEMCGEKVNKKSAPQRFGKHFCSQEHAAQYVAKVNASKMPKQRSGGGCC